MLQWMKDQSKRRRLLLSEQLGIQESEQLYQVLGTEDERNQLYLERLTTAASPQAATTATALTPSSSSHRPSALLAPPNSSLSYGASVLLSSDATEFGSSLDHQQQTINSALTSNQSFTIDQNNPAGFSCPSYLNKNAIAARGGKSHLKRNFQSNNDGDNKQFTAKLVNSDDDDDQRADTKYEYKGSSAFLKGTQSANPHNDYCQHYLDTGQRPQNFIRDYELHDRFEEYPKLKELIKLKNELIVKTATPPMYLKCDLQQPSHLRHLDCKFDVILIDPPLEEYQRTRGVTKTRFWSWESLKQLEIEEIAAQRSFIFLWCGSSDGLDLGRQCLRKWGFRRCEDICWIKTNKTNIGHNKNLEPKAVFQRTKEHCLMGIKGTVRRSTDGDFIHSNVDIDLIISEEAPYGSYEKPEEIFHIIEHFCLGRRRLHLFGRDSTIRPGWLTVGPELTNSNFNHDLYQDYFSRGPADHLTGCTNRIEALRPKSPPSKMGAPNSSIAGSSSMAGYARKRF